MTHTFPVCFYPDSKILILGSIPSVTSRELGFYYMHPRNRFWQVLSALYCEKIGDSIISKKAFLKKHKIALWDVIESCQIHASSDSSITNVVATDLKSLLSKTQITRIYTTGKKAYQLYQKYGYPKTGIEAICLPSTSPANAKCSFEELVNQYQVIREGE